MTTQFTPYYETGMHRSCQHTIPREHTIATTNKLPNQPTSVSYKLVYGAPPQSNQSNQKHTNQLHFKQSVHTYISNPFQSQATSNSPQELPCLRVSTTAAAHRTSHSLNRTELSCPPILYIHLLSVTHIISMACFQGPDRQMKQS